VHMWWPFLASAAAHGTARRWAHECGEGARAAAKHLTVAVPPHTARLSALEPSPTESLSRASTASSVPEAPVSALA
jgi:hypothetical protein